MLMQILSEHK